MMNANISIRDLPIGIQEWARLTDVPTVLKVLREWGGLKVYIPTKLSESSPWVALVGADHARTIIDVFGNQHVDIPSFRRRSLKVRILAFPTDTPTREIAKKVRCTERYVRMVRRQCMEIVTPPCQHRF